MFSQIATTWYSILTLYWHIDFFTLKLFGSQNFFTVTAIKLKLAAAQITMEMSFGEI